jgi:hypothetical protein
MRGDISNSRCGGAELDADSPARHSSLVSQAWWTGPPPIRSPRTTTGRDRVTRSSRRSPSCGAACGFWIRAWGQREPAVEGTGRSNGPARPPDSFKGGLDISSIHGQFSSLYREHPAGRGRTILASRAGRIGCVVSHPITGSLNDDRFLVLHQPIDQGRWQGVVRFELVARFPDGSIRREHDRSNFITGGDNPEQQSIPRLPMGK